MKKIMALASALMLVLACVNAQSGSSTETKIPPPPPPPKVTVVKFKPPVIVKDNDKGYAIRVYVDHGDSTVSVTNDNGTQKIKMKDWNVKKSYYENKYGKIPPPPPAAPLPPSPPPKEPVRSES